MSSTLTALTEATTFATTDLGYAAVSGNSRKFTFATLGQLFGTGTLSFAAGTITTSQPLSLTQTWNSGAVAFIGLRITITSTGSLAGSRALEVVMPSANDKYSVATATATGGSILAGIRADGFIAAQGFFTADDATAGIFQQTLSSTTGFAVRNTSSYGFSSTASWFDTEDVQLWRDAASALAQRTSTTAQIFRVYRTFTDSSNYERLTLQTGSGYVELAAETAGTGTDNLDVRLTPAGTGVFRVGETIFFGGVGAPSGGSTSARITFTTTSGFGIYVGSSAPTVSAAQGSIYLRTDGSSTSTRLYVNTDGSTGWTNFTSAT